MRKIHRLPEELIAKIAAGEVIERPSYAVKELIDNAIDAHATVIEIQIEESGLKRVTVVDNGEGMGKDDLEICFLPHTTSKIKPTDELVGIKTLGFRGEALSSLAAVSHMTIITRTPKDIGGRIIQIRGGIVEDSAPIGTPIGTIVTAEGIFYSVPARKKFLKSAKTELRHITDIVTEFAIAHPEIHILLRHNKKTILDLPKKSDDSDRLKTVLGTSFTEQLIPFSYEDSYIKLSGWLGKPQIASKQNQKQFIFVNGRRITDKMLSLALKEAFGSLLPASATPVFIMYLTLPHQLVDVNIHPRKEQVGFSNAKELFTAVKLAAAESLKKHNITFHLAKFANENSARLGETGSFSGSLLRETVLPWNRAGLDGKRSAAQVIQIHQTYIFTTTKEGLVLVDQHAAHERILYEKFMDAFKKEKKQGKQLQLANPLLLHLSISETHVIEEQADFFTDLGITVEPFQGQSFRILAVPTVLQGRNIEKIIKDILADFADENFSKSIDDRSQRMLAYLSCRAAKKEGDVLSQNEMQELLKELEKTENNRTCPHGRPTKVAISLKELNTAFKR